MPQTHVHNIKEVFICIIPVATTKHLHTPKARRMSDHKSAYIIGSGLAALTAACYLVRDGQMKGEHIHVF